MWRSANSLPMLREPECSINQTKFSVSRQTSMKWLPPPSVPSCFIAFALRSRTPSWSSPKSFQPSQYEDSSTDSLYELKPTGISSSIAKRKSFNRPSRMPLLNGVFTAIMPQPMSTPTVAGITASFVAMTEPTMLPLPKCASGIKATCRNKHGKRETLRSIDCSSMLKSWLAHDRISLCAPPIGSFL